MNPCGMGVDALRSCYSADMKMFSDSDELTRVRWYFVPDTTPILPMPIAFGSALYDRQEQPEGEVGERFDPHPWRGGYPPEPVPEASQKWCGDNSEWLNGTLASTTLPPLWPGSDVPICCPQVLDAFGGSFPGAIQPSTCQDPCVCGLFLPPILTATFTVQFGVCPGWAGTVIPLSTCSTDCAQVGGYLTVGVSPVFSACGISARLWFGCTGAGSPYLLRIMSADCSTVLVEGAMVINHCNRQRWGGSLAFGLIFGVCLNCFVGVRIE